MKAQQAKLNRRLFAGAAAGNVIEVREALRLGADPSAKNGQGRTPKQEVEHSIRKKLNRQNKAVERAVLANWESPGLPPEVAEAVNGFGAGFDDFRKIIDLLQSRK